MSNNTLAVNITGETSNFANAMNQCSSSLGGMGMAALGWQGMVIGATAAVTGAVLNAAASVVGSVADMTSSFVGWGVQLAAEAEDSRISFEVLLGSADKAAKMLKQIEDFSITTPFAAADLQGSAQMLLNFGVDAQKVMPLMKRLGDVAAGDANKLKSLALAMGQVSSGGKLTGQDLLQMINAGFNPLNEISKTTGRSMADLKKDMEKGKISVEMVEGAFKSATSAGGLFSGMMEKKGQTLTAQWNTLQEKVGLAARGLAENLITAFDFKGLLESGSSLLAMFQEQFARLGEPLAKVGSAISKAFGFESLLPNATTFIELMTTGLTDMAVSFLNGPMMDAIPFLVEGFWKVADVVKYVTMAVLNFGGNVSDFFGKLLDLIGAVLDTARKAAIEAGKFVGGEFGERMASATVDPLRLGKGAMLAGQALQGSAKNQWAAAAAMDTGKSAREDIADLSKWLKSIRDMKPEEKAPPKIEEAIATKSIGEMLGNAFGGFIKFGQGLDLSKLKLPDAAKDRQASALEVGSKEAFLALNARGRQTTDPAMKSLDELKQIKDGVQNMVAGIAALKPKAGEQLTEFASFLGGGLGF